MIMAVILDLDSPFNCLLLQSCSQDKWHSKAFQEAVLLPTTTFPVLQWLWPQQMQLFPLALCFSHLPLWTPLAYDCHSFGQITPLSNRYNHLFSIKICPSASYPSHPQWYLPHEELSAPRESNLFILNAVGTPLFPTLLDIFICVCFYLPF